MIYVRTCAYNAEKTLERAIESILHQTHEEFTYYILDNGSTDKTREIIQRYAEQDKRIVPFYSDVNFNLEDNYDFWSIYYSLLDGDYFCMLDADDAYESTFLEEALQMITDYDLDIVMCGSMMMNMETWTPIKNQTLSRDMVLKSNDAFGAAFSFLYWNLRAMWGKLYSAKAAKFPYTDVLGMPEWYPYAYGGDTVNVFASVEMADGIGIIGKALHYYAISNKTVSYRWLEGREKSAPLLFNKAEELLMKKCSKVSERNYRVLYGVYFHAVNDTLHILFGSDLEAERKVNLAREIITHPITQKMFGEQFDVSLQERSEFFVYTVFQILSLCLKENHISYTVLEEIFATINRDAVQLLTKESFAWYMKKCPMVVQNVVLRKYEEAVNELLVFVNQKGTNIKVDFPYVLGQQLSALQGAEQKYIFFSKKLIQWYIVNRQIERAKMELEEWSALLPDDKDIQDLCMLCDMRQSR